MYYWTNSSRKFYLKQTSRSSMRLKKSIKYTIIKTYDSSQCRVMRGAASSKPGSIWSLATRDTRVWYVLYKFLILQTVLRSSD